MSTATGYLAGSQEGGLAAQMAAMQHTLAAIETKVAGLEADVTKLMHRTSLNLLLARQYNSNATDILHALQPVPHPDTGALPADGLFPATLAEFYEATPARLDSLLTFYGLDTSGTLAAKQSRLRRFVGN